MPSLTPQETLTYHALHSLIRAILPANIDLRANIYNRFDINLVFVCASLRGRIIFTMTGMDRLSPKVPPLCRMVPSTPTYHMEDIQ